VSDVVPEQLLAEVQEDACREWVRENPDKDERDFTAHAWPQLRKQLTADRHKLLAEAAGVRLRRTGRYDPL
jgi:hypothetical protein